MMRKSILTLSFLLAIAAIAVVCVNHAALAQENAANPQDETAPSSVLDGTVVLAAPQDQDPPPPPETQGSPSDVPVQPTPDAIAPGAPAAGQPMGTFAIGSCCHTCGHVRCCCPPPCVKQVICLTEPCSCCTHEVCVKVPACCAGQAPVVQWRDGILGRKIATLCWTCCNHKVKVVIPVFGKPRVWPK